MTLLKLVRTSSSKYLACSVVFFVVASPFLVHAQALEGRVVSVSDGDTLTLLTRENSQIRVRLAEIDAPESGQPFGAQSKRLLSDLAFGQEIFVRDTSLDRYGRVVGRVFVGEIDVCREMVRTGGAWVFDRYVKDKTLYKQQSLAREARAGLWKLSNPIPPWEWRRGARDDSNDSTPKLSNQNSVESTGCMIKGNINRKGDRIYHVPGSRDYDATKISESKGELWFCSEQEALNAGWRRPNR